MESESESVSGSGSCSGSGSNPKNDFIHYSDFDFESDVDMNTLCDVISFDKEEIVLSKDIRHALKHKDSSVIPCDPTPASFDGTGKDSNCTSASAVDISTSNTAGSSASTAVHLNSTNSNETMNSSDNFLFPESSEEFVPSEYHSFWVDEARRLDESAINVEEAKRLFPTAELYVSSREVVRNLLKLRLTEEEKSVFAIVRANEGIPSKQNLPLIEARMKHCYILSKLAGAFKKVGCHLYGFKPFYEAHQAAIARAGYFNQKRNNNSRNSTKKKPTDKGATTGRDLPACSTRSPPVSAMAVNSAPSLSATQSQCATNDFNKPNHDNGRLSIFFPEAGIGFNMKDVNLKNLIHLYPTAKMYALSRRTLLNEFVSRFNSDELQMWNTLHPSNSRRPTESQLLAFTTSPSASASLFAATTGDAPAPAESSVRLLRHNGKRLYQKLSYWVRKLGCAVYGESAYQSAAASVPRSQLLVTLNRNANDLSDVSHDVIDLLNADDDSTDNQLDAIDSSEGLVTNSPVNLSSTPPSTSISAPTSVTSEMADIAAATDSSSRFNDSELNPVVALASAGEGVHSSTEQFQCSDDNAAMDTVHSTSDEAEPLLCLRLRPADWLNSDAVSNRAPGYYHNVVVKTDIDFNILKSSYPTASEYVSHKEDVCRSLEMKLGVFDKQIYRDLIENRLEGNSVTTSEKRHRASKIRTKILSWFRKIGHYAYGVKEFECCCDRKNKSQYEGEELASEDAVRIKIPSESLLTKRKAESVSVAADPSRAQSDEKGYALVKRTKIVVTSDLSDSQDHDPDQQVKQLLDYDCPVQVFVDSIRSALDQYSTHRSVPVSQLIAAIMTCSSAGSGSAAASVCSNTSSMRYDGNGDEEQERAEEAEVSDFDDDDEDDEGSYIDACDDLRVTNISTRNHFVVSFPSY